MEYMLGRLNNDADMSSGCCDADVLVRLQGLGRQSLPSGAMQLEGVGCVPGKRLNFAGFE